MRKAPQEVKQLIHHYFNLNIMNKAVKTPYHINIKHVRGELRSLVGKGTPLEIEDDVNIFAKLRKFDLQKASGSEIRKFMQTEGIGVDCSGFVAHILDTWLKAENQGNLKSSLTFPKTSLKRKILICMRPIENINANLLTNDINSIPIKIEEAQPGDLIRLKGITKGHHIAIITDANEEKITYIHSTRHYGEDNGIKEGIIKIKNKGLDLEKQEWLEKDKDGVCWTLKQYLKEKDDNGLRRPKFFLEKQ